MMYTAKLSDYLQQLAAASEIEIEYRRRLAAEGFEMGEGATYDEIVVTSDEQSRRVAEIFREVCEEHRNRQE